MGMLEGGGGVGRRSRPRGEKGVRAAHDGVSERRDWFRGLDKGL